MPFDLVAEVRCFFGRLRASSNAYFRMRSVPARENTLCWNTTSRGVPSYMRPPTDEYSPSVFSRTTRKSISPGRRPASGDGTPGIRRQGRKFTYWSNSRLNFSSDPQSDTWSGTVAGQPTAPKKIASFGASWSFQSSGIICP